MSTANASASACPVPTVTGASPWAPPPAGRVRLWLPCLAGCRLGAVLGDGTFAEPVACPPDLLVLGDSIAQGFTSLDPAISWPALLADSLGLGLVNQGVGGQVFQPGTLVGLAGAVRPEHIVVEFGANYRFEPCQAGRVEQEVRTYLYEVAATWPEVPTWVMTTLPHTEVAYPNHLRSCFAEVDGIIRRCAARHGSMRVVDGSALLDAGDLARLLADGSDILWIIGDRISAAYKVTAESQRILQAEIKGGSTHE